MTSDQQNWRYRYKTYLDFIARRKGFIAITLAMIITISSALYPYFTHVQSNSSTASYFTVIEVPILETVDVVGRIEPSSTNSITAPFDGVIANYSVLEGQRVNRGQPLVELDKGELEIKLRDARSMYLKSESTFKTLSNWATGPEVMQARRRLLTAQLLLDELEARRAEAERLYSRGIIPKVELDTYSQQAQTQRLELEAAQAEVTSTLTRGDQSNVDVARLELDNARTKLRSLELLAQQGLLVAPFDGVVSKPSSASERTPSPDIRQGVYVVRGQVLLDVVDAEKLVAKAAIDELDINSIQVNQRVVITGLGDPMTGRVKDVASRAVSQTGDGAAKFGISVELPPLNKEQQQRIKIGMRAKLSVVTYENPKAMVVPPSSISQIDDHDFVQIIDGSAEKSIPVKLGVSTQQGVEVLSGLTPGMKVISIL